jgi:hypothetical protein
MAMGISVGRRILGEREYSGVVDYMVRVIWESVSEFLKQIAGQRLSHDIS